MDKLLFVVSKIFRVVGHQVYTHFRGIYGLVLFYGSFLNPSGFLAAAWQLEVSAPSTDFL